MINNGEDKYQIYSQQNSIKNTDLDNLDVEENVKINDVYPYGQSHEKVINLIPQVCENESNLKQKIDLQNNLLINEFDKKNFKKSDTKNSNISSIPFPSQDFRVNSNSDRSFKESYENSSRSSILRNGLSSERSEQEMRLRERSIKNYLEHLEKSLTRRGKDFISVNDIDGGDVNLKKFNTFNSIMEETIANEKNSLRTFDLPNNNIKLRSKNNIFEILLNHFKIYFLYFLGPTVLIKSSSKFSNKTLRNNSFSLDKFKQFEMSPQISSNKTYKNFLKILESNENIEDLPDHEYTEFNQNLNSHFDKTTEEVNKKFLNELILTSENKDFNLNSSGNLLLNFNKEGVSELTQTLEKNNRRKSLEKNLQYLNNVEKNSTNASDIYKGPPNTPRLGKNIESPSQNNQLVTSVHKHRNHHKRKKKKSIKPLNQKDPLYKLRPESTETDDNMNDDRTSVKQFKNVYDSMDDDEDENKLHYLIDENFQSDPWVFSKDSKFRKCWSFIIFILIVYSITVSPVKIAFNEETTTVNYLDLVVDCLFILDVILNFFTPFKDEDNNLIGNHRMIVLDYLTSWFFFDLISCFPTDLLTYSFESSDPSAFQLKKIIRLSRLYRLGRWLKVLRFIKLAKDADNYSSINFVYGLELNRLVSFGVVTIILIHISSCLWIYIAQINDDYDNWIHKSFFELNEDHFSLYIASFYFTFCTISTIGYGDIISSSLLERVYNIILLIVGVILFSFCLSALSSIFSKLDEKAINLQNKISTLEAIQKEYDIPNGLINKIRKTIKHEIKKTNIERYEFIESLPTAIKSQIFLVIHKHHIKNLNFFKGQSYDFILYVLPLFKSQPLTKSDTLFSIGEFVEEMYLVTQGVLSLNLGPVYDHIEIAQIRKGNHIGDVLLYLHEQSPYDLKCKCDNTEVLVIKRNDFFKIKMHFNSKMLFILQNSMKKMELFEKRRIITTTLRKYETDPKIINLKLKNLNAMLMYKEFDSYYNPEGQYSDIYDSLESISDADLLNLMGIDQRQVEALNNIKIEFSENKNHSGGIKKMPSGGLYSGFKSLKTLSYDEKNVEVQSIYSNKKPTSLFRNPTLEKLNKALKNESDNWNKVENKQEKNSNNDKDTYLKKQPTLKGNFNLQKKVTSKEPFQLTTKKTIKSEKKQQMKKIVNEILFVNLIRNKTNETLNTQFKANDVIEPILKLNNCKNSTDKEIETPSKSGVSTPNRKKTSHCLNLGMLKEELEEVKKAGELGQENAENLHIKKIKENIDELKKFKRRKSVFLNTGKSTKSLNSDLKLQNIQCEINDDKPNESDKDSERCNSSRPKATDTSFVEDDRLNKSVNTLEEKEENYTIKRSPKKKLSQHFKKDGNNININVYQYETNYNQNYIFLSNSNQQNNSSEYSSQKESNNVNNINLNLMKSQNNIQDPHKIFLNSPDENDNYFDINSNSVSRQNIKRSSSLGDVSFTKKIPIQDFKLKSNIENELKKQSLIENPKNTNEDVFKLQEIWKIENEYETPIIYYTQPSEKVQKDIKSQTITSQRNEEKELNKNYKKVDRLYYYMQKMVSLKKQGSIKPSFETISSGMSDGNI
jgi:hypothetical protein